MPYVTQQLQDAAGPVVAVTRLHAPCRTRSAVGARRLRHARRRRLRLLRHPAGGPPLLPHRRPVDRGAGAADAGQARRGRPVGWPARRPRSTGCTTSPPAPPATRAASPSRRRRGPTPAGPRHASAGRQRDPSRCRPAALRPGAVVDGIQIGWTHADHRAPAPAPPPGAAWSAAPARCRPPPSGGWRPTTTGTAPCPPRTARGWAWSPRPASAPSSRGTATRWAARTSPPTSSAPPRAS